MTIPQKLKPGDTVAVIAPSGVVNAGKLRAGAGVLEGMGLRVRIMPGCRMSHGYLAAPDGERLRDLHAAFSDEEIRAVFAARGGYGAARLLPYIDYSLIRRNPKIFAGFSDITALHIAFNQRCNLVTYHAPMPAADLPGADERTLESFRAELFAGSGTLPGMYTLTGGNLTVIAAGIGTPFEIDTRGKMLFMEETGEPPYRVDRLFVQLKQAGKFRDAAGFVLGDFSPENLTTIKLAVSELLVPEGKPVITGVPCGHCMPNITLPLGQVVSLVTESVTES
jgi:muramoyltetrapeptide carboxypeptidase